MAERKARLQHTAGRTISPEKIAAQGDKAPCVYMLRCRDDSLYTGWTNDFPRRLAAHQSGQGAKYTRSRLPVEAAYLEYVPDKLTATRREREIKKLRPEQKRALLRSDKNCLRNSDAD